MAVVGTMCPRASIGSMAMVIRLEDSTTGDLGGSSPLTCAAENGQVALTEHDETVAVLIDPGVLASLVDTVDLFTEGRRGPSR